MPLHLYKKVNILHYTRGITDDIFFKKVCNKKLQETKIMNVQTTKFSVL